MERIRKALEKAEDESRPLAGGRYRASGARGGMPAPAPEKVEYTRTKIAKLGRWKARRNRLITMSDDPRAASFRVLRTRLLQMCRQYGWRTLGVTSMNSGAGKTFAAANIAVSIAREPNQTVLLVDLDLHRPRLASVFSTKVDIGLRDCLTKQADLADALFNPGIERLVVLPGRGTERRASELLASRTTQDLFHEMVSRYESRIILCDLAPLSASDDVLVCMQYLDAMILVVEYGRSNKQEVERCLELIGDKPIAAIVLNKVRHPGKPDEYYEYGRY